MCGIAGIAAPPGKAVRLIDLKRLAGEMIHRGPDDKGFYLSENRQVGFAHRRLKVIDLDGGSQPMQNEDGTQVLIFNGEIYNYQSLREKLIEKGHNFMSKSDTEVIVHLYEEYGFASLDYLRGMFAFVIYDATKNSLFGAVDRMGKKPLYYSTINGFLYFASTFNALISLTS